MNLFDEQEQFFLFTQGIRTQSGQQILDFQKQICNTFRFRLGSQGRDPVEFLSQGNVVLQLGKQILQLFQHQNQVKVCIFTNCLHKFVNFGGTRLNQPITLHFFRFIFHSTQPQPPLKPFQKLLKVRTVKGGQCHRWQSAVGCC